MIAIPVLQFLPPKRGPNAEKRWCTTEVSDQAGEKWMRLEKLGVRLTAECVPGFVHVCIDHEGKGADYAMILVGSSELPEEITRMILAVDEDDLKDWITRDDEDKNYEQPH